MVVFNSIINKMTETTLTIENGWQVKYFTIRNESLEFRLMLKYKNHLTSNLEYQITDEFEHPITFVSNDFKLYELKMMALKTCYVFLKTGASILENEDFNNTPQ